MIATKEKLLRNLKNLGVEPGDILFIHSSASLKDKLLRGDNLAGLSPPLHMDEVLTAKLV